MEGAPSATEMRMGVALTAGGGGGGGEGGGGGGGDRCQCVIEAERMMDENGRFLEFPHSLGSKVFLHWPIDLRMNSN